MQNYIVRHESITSYGRTINKGSVIEQDRINPEHLDDLLKQKAIEPIDDEETTVNYTLLDEE